MGRVESSNALVHDRWLEHARKRPDAEAVVHWSITQPPRRWTWGTLVDQARRYAARLAAAGIAPGQVCALIVRHRCEFYPLYLGVSLSGAIPAVLAYPNPRIHPDKFRQGLEGMARVSGLDWILTETDLAPAVASLTTLPGASVRGVLCPLDDAADLPEPMPLPRAGAVRNPDAPCLLQHSSGTTGLQKAVMLSHRAVLEHVDRYAAAIGAAADDRVVSWLPLYHDMGFIAAFHQSLALGIPLIQLDPFEWVQAPYLLLDALAKEKGTLCWLPNFAYNLMADRVHEDDLEGVRLDGVRRIINCSEPIRADSQEMFLRRFAPYGLREEALATCYAMAETTFAVTQTPAGRTPLVVAADRGALAAGTYRPAASASGPEVRRCVSSGHPISGCAVRVVGEDGRDLPEGHVGELLVRSVSLFDGYRNQPAKTREAFLDGWYRSGDLGFVLAEDVFVIGRKKDLIIVAGKNLCPEDIEDAVGAVPGVLPGRVVAFGVERAEKGTEEIHVVAETEIAGAAERKALTLAIQRAGMEVDVTIARVLLVPPRWLIKSTSGKISRSANRERALEERQAA